MSLLQARASSTPRHRQGVARIIAIAAPARKSGCHSAARRARRALALATSAVAGSPFLATGASAQSTTWNGGSGNWSDLPNWSNGFPSDLVDVFIDGGKPAGSVVYIDGPGSTRNLTLDANDVIVYSNSKQTGLYIYGDGAINGTVLMGLLGNNSALLGIALGKTLGGTGTIDTGPGIGGSIVPFTGSGPASAPTIGSGLLIQGNNLAVDGSDVGIINNATIRTSGTLFFQHATNQGSIQTAGDTYLTSAINTGSISAGGRIFLTNFTNGAGGVLSVGSFAQADPMQNLGGTINVSGFFYAQSFTNGAGSTLNVNSGGVFTAYNEFANSGAVNVNPGGELRLSSTNFTTATSPATPFPTGAVAPSPSTTASSTTPAVISS
jgi:hypothetical protein